ncbi:MAG: T9SS type A sorting domain-containing protein [Ignavibacteriae bacterium]|nr:T9SS C-terminal target domain-containing protein [Ignavibacteriota bacterium]NOG96378.1 T9SS type A sorting domain-containing protein [Ignavibacteriota bacterium]
MKKFIIFLNMLITLSVFGQNISVSKDTVTFLDFWISQEASDSIHVYNNDSNVLSIDSIYSQNYMYYLKISHNDSLVNEFLMHSQNMIPLFVDIPAHDSAKIVFYLFIPIIKESSSPTIYTDTISILNNSINNPIKRITALTDITLGILDENYLPHKFVLSQNYPNPFNPSTTIKFTIPKYNFVTLKIFDLLGREVATLLNEEKPPGVHEVVFDTRLQNGQGISLASGVYIYQIKSGNFTASKKFVLMK